MIKEKSLRNGKILVILCVTLLLSANVLVGCSSKEIKNDKEDVVQTDSAENKAVATAIPMPTATVTPVQTATSAPTATPIVTPIQTATPTPKSEEAEIAKEITGDSMGNIASPNPPQDSSYRIIKMDHDTDLGTNIVLYIENIDDANFNFYFTRAEKVAGEDQPIDENVIFKKHVAHYTEKGYYEYNGEQYNILFKYDEGDGQVAGDYVVEVYGMEKIYNISDYLDGDEGLSLEGKAGIAFSMGRPFAG